MSHFHMGSDPNFGISADELEALIGANNPTEALDKKGGIEGLADALNSSLEGGISGAEVSGGFGKRKKEFGENKFPEPKVPSIFALWWDAYKDEMIIILTVAAVVSLVLGLFFEQDPDKTTEGYSVNLQGGIEGIAILGAIIIVTTVQALNNYSQEKQFQSLNKTKNDIKIKVIRGGEKTECQIGELVVGDVVVLDTGNQVPADGFYISGYNCQADESNMTGESEPSKKSEKKRQMLSGCHVTTGDCTMMVTAVGTRSLWGKALKEIDEASDRAETPLQKKLGLLARNIGFLGLAVAGIVFVVLCIYYVVDQITSSREDDYEWEWSSLTTILEAFITAVTIVVVAVPEGLPLAVTIALAFSMKKMMKDNNLVRHLPACETMGGATQICSDKTGTLTQNRMHVTAGMVATERFTDPNLNNLNDTVHHLLTEGLARNTTSYLKPPKNPGGAVQYIGQPTECALLAWINKLNVDYEDIRKQGPKITQRFPFSSARKRMSCVLPVHEGGYRMYTKGASEIILKRCTNILNKDGRVVALDNHTSEDLMQFIEELASRGLRTIGVAYRDFEVFDTTSNFDEREEDEPPEMKLTLIAIAGIEDPVRPEVPDAVKTCQQAGITVRMVTGDNILTARSIAKQCNILTEGGQAIEGPDFAKMSDEQIDAILPKLQVLARSSPSDKIRLVKRLRANSELVAVTGDGTNDAPALKGAHVGLAMGSGTEVAREASDIIILDDNFSSIVKSVMWGRCVFDNIRKFLVFQLTVNVAALCIAALAALVDSTPLTAVQLLWVNLIMDSFGALALATEPPTPALLQRPPLNVAHKKTSLISPEMWKMILGSSAYQVAVLMGGLFGIRYIPYYNNLLYPDGEGSENPNFTEEDMEDITNSIVFNAFIYCQVFNLVACRKVNPKEYNPFKGFFHNIIFFVIFIGIGLVQILLVGICIENPQDLCTTNPQRIFSWLEWIGVIFDTVALGGWQWLACIGVGFGGFIWSFILRLIPVCDEKRYKGDLNAEGDEDGSDDESAGEHKSLLPKGSHDNF